jgi:hypothetical protein
LQEKSQFSLQHSVACLIILNCLLLTCISSQTLHLIQTKIISIRLYVNNGNYQSQYKNQQQQVLLLLVIVTISLSARSTDESIDWLPGEHSLVIWRISHPQMVNFKTWCLPFMPRLRLPCLLGKMTIIADKHLHKHPPSSRTVIFSGSECY